MLLKCLWGKSDWGISTGYRLRERGTLFHDVKRRAVSNSYWFFLRKFSNTLTFKSFYRCLRQKPLSREGMLQGSLTPGIVRQAWRAMLQYIWNFTTSPVSSWMIQYKKEPRTKRGLGTCHTLSSSMLEFRSVIAVVLTTAHIAYAELGRDEDNMGTYVSSKCANDFIKDPSLRSAQNVMKVRFHTRSFHSSLLSCCKIIIEQMYFIQKFGRA